MTSLSKAATTTITVRLHAKARMTPQSIAQAITETPEGFAMLCVVCAIISLLFISSISHFLRGIIKPQIEHRFYHKILDHWLGPFYSKYKIIATFIRLQGFGETVVDGIVNIIGTFFIVAFLSSTLTSLGIFIYQYGFHYSLLLLALVCFASMLSWALIHQLIYFHRLTYRLK